MVKSIAIIGHGKSPEGKGWGVAIDACDLVIRMWDWDWQQQSIADYGEHYDYGVVALIDFSMKPFLAATNKPQPRIGWLGYARGAQTARYRDIPFMELIDQRHRDEAVKMGAKSSMNLTRGCAAACWALEATDSEVILVGFDNLRLQKPLEIEDAFPDAVLENWDTWHPGWRGRLYSPQKQGSHNIAIERPLLERIAARKGVTLHFADDLWS